VFAKKTYLTNYSSLGQLVDIYNRKLDVAEQRSYVVDRQVVTIRDAIAHGRLMAYSEEFPLTLYKFGKTKARMVTEKMADLKYYENRFRNKERAGLR
jgi:C1A family cysteine protease